MGCPPTGDRILYSLFKHDDISGVLHIKPFFVTFDKRKIEEKQRKDSTLVVKMEAINVDELRKSLMAKLTDLEKIVLFGEPEITVR